MPQDPACHHYPEETKEPVKPLTKVNYENKN